MHGCPPPFSNSMHAIEYALARIRNETDAVGSILADAGGALEWAIENEELSALKGAIERQVENIERWLETGVAASPEESKSIYDQLKTALKRAV